MRSRRDIATFSLSFLDCISCGFGAIILLLVLSKTTEPIILEGIREDLDGVVLKLQKELLEIRGETNVVNRTLIGKKEQLSKDKERLAQLQGDFSSIRGEFAAAKQEAAIKNTIEGRLATAKQDLTAEMQRLLGADFQRPASDVTIGGVPVDSEYIIFVIDTSNSMRDNSWGLVLQKVSETLDIYPVVKGIQIMNDMGDYMFSQYRRKWIPDTPGRRKAILDRLSTWSPFSNSSPVEGIYEAVRSFYSSDRKISVYVFGDDFQGGSIESVVDAIDRINQEDRTGERLVRIHAVGFPVQFGHPDYMRVSGARFAALMRILCDKNGGTFVGLNSIRP